MFFVVPDVIVGLVALRWPKKALWAGLVAVAGACVGGAALYVAAAVIGNDLGDVMRGVPFVHPEMLEIARRELMVDGGMAIVNAPSQGIPYKLYAAQWSLLGWDLPTLVLWTIPARAFRIVTFGLVMGAIGFLFRRNVQKRPAPWVAAYVMAWTIFYGYFWFVLTPSRFGQS